MSPGEKLIFGLLLLGYFGAQAEKLESGRMSAIGTLFWAWIFIVSILIMLYGLAEVVNSWA